MDLLAPASWPGRPIGARARMTGWLDGATRCDRGEERGAGFIIVITRYRSLSAIRSWSAGRAGKIFRFANNINNSPLGQP